MTEVLAAQLEHTHWSGGMHRSGAGRVTVVLCSLKCKLWPVSQILPGGDARIS